MPPAVAAELGRGRALGVDLPDVATLQWVRIQTPTDLGKLPATADLGAGEREVLALGIELRNAVLILDERLGRVYAGTLGLAFTGTLGILLRAKAEGRISAIAPVIERLDSLKFRLSAKTRAAVLRQAEEVGGKR